MEKNPVYVEKNPVKMEKNIAWIHKPSTKNKISGENHTTNNPASVDYAIPHIAKIYAIEKYDC